MGRVFIVGTRLKVISYPNSPFSETGQLNSAFMFLSAVRVIAFDRRFSTVSRWAAPARRASGAGRMLGAEQAELVLLLRASARSSARSRASELLPARSRPSGSRPEPAERGVACSEPAERGPPGAGRARGRSSSGLAACSLARGGRRSSRFHGFAALLKHFLCWLGI